LSWRGFPDRSAEAAKAALPTGCRTGQLRRFIYKSVLKASIEALQILKQFDQQERQRADRDISVQQPAEKSFDVSHGQSLPPF
jgi:hypothetical protein